METETCRRMVANDKRGASGDGIWDGEATNKPQEQPWTEVDDEVQRSSGREMENPWWGSQNWWTGTGRTASSVIESDFERSSDNEVNTQRRGQSWKRRGWTDRIFAFVYALAPSMARVMGLHTSVVTCWRVFILHWRSTKKKTNFGMKGNCKRANFSQILPSLSVKFCQKSVFLQLLFCSSFPSRWQNKITVNLPSVLCQIHFQTWVLQYAFSSSVLLPI